MVALPHAVISTSDHFLNLHVKYCFIIFITLLVCLYLHFFPPCPVRLQQGVHTVWH